MTLKLPVSVLVVVHTAGRDVLLLERAARRGFWQSVTGSLESADEPAPAAARRELREETGYKAKSWRHLGVLHPCIGYSNERIEIFLAHGLSYVGHEPDHGEFLEVIELSLADALLAVRDGDITDGKSIASLFWAEKIFSGAWQVPA